MYMDLFIKLNPDASDDELSGKFNYVYELSNDSIKKIIELIKSNI